MGSELSLEYGKTDAFNSVLVSALDVCLCSFEPWHFFSMFKYFMFVLHLYTVISGVSRSMLLAATGPLLLIMVALCNRADHYIFALLFLASIFFFFLA